MTHTCYGCANLEHCHESWEMPHIQWYECAVHEGYANLTSFPFLNTKCPDWVSSVKKEDLESIPKELMTRFGKTLNEGEKNG